MFAYMEHAAIGAVIGIVAALGAMVAGAPLPWALAIVPVPTVGCYVLARVRGADHPVYD